MLMDAIATELKAAIDSDEGAMLSKLVHDQPQVIEIEELKMRLNARSASEMDRLTVEKEALRRLQVAVKNTENDIQEEDQMLILENGALMRHSRLDKPFRCIGLCQSNVAGNEVTGTATGGYEVFSAAEGVNVHLIDYHSGELSHIFVGGVDGQADVGHTGVVTCLCHDGNYLFSGATDELIICWNTVTREKALVMRGHEGTVVSLAVETTMLVSGGADATLRLWNKHNGEHLRVLFGHSKSVLSIEIGPTWLLTGGADHEVRVWKVSSKNRHSARADCTYRMMGHDCAVTCVRYGKMEILSGDMQGRIFIWWMNTGEIIRRCQVHKGPVKCMQFDSVHIVS
jgi:WD40 repeat protein